MVDESIPYVQPHRSNSPTRKCKVTKPYPYNSRRSFEASHLKRRPASIQKGWRLSLWDVYSMKRLWSNLFWLHLVLMVSNGWLVWWVMSGSWSWDVCSSSLHPWLITPFSLLSISHHFRHWDQRLASSRNVITSLVRSTLVLSFPAQLRCTANQLRGMNKTNTKILTPLMPDISQCRWSECLFWRNAYILMLVWIGLYTVVVDNVTHLFRFLLLLTLSRNRDWSGNNH